MTEGLAKAVVGSGRVVVGSDQKKCRVNVYVDLFDDVVDALEKQHAQTLAGITPQLEGYAAEGKTREGVVIPLFDLLLEKLEKVS